MNDENTELEATETLTETDADETDTASDGTVIRDTDIVFDCPHCGHNLAVDYRGAGLTINCPHCEEPVLIPIPEGMKIDDLDVEPGEILKQLFATRRNLQKAEQHAQFLQGQLDSLQALVQQMGEIFTSVQA